MPDYPANTKDAQQRAARIARHYGNLECVQCAKAIVQALGPNVDAEVLKLRCSDDSGGIQLPSAEQLVSWTGQHVGVRVGNKVFDNHHYDGILAARWSTDFVAATGAALTLYRKPIDHFFNKILRWREFANFVSNRREDE